LPGAGGADTVPGEVAAGFDSAEAPIVPDAGAAIGTSALGLGLGLGLGAAAWRAAGRTGGGGFFAGAGFVVRADFFVAGGARFLDGADRFAGAGRFAAARGFALAGLRADCAAFTAARSCLRTRRLALRADLSSALSVRTRALAAWTALRRVADSPMERFVFMNPRLPVRDPTTHTLPLQAALTTARTENLTGSNGRSLCHVRAPGGFA
jgi:hypothetical protein